MCNYRSALIIADTFISEISTQTFAIAQLVPHFPTSITKNAGKHDILFLKNYLTSYLNIWTKNKKKCKLLVILTLSSY